MTSLSGGGPGLARFSGTNHCEAASKWVLRASLWVSGGVQLLRLLVTEAQVSLPRSAGSSQAQQADPRERQMMGEAWDQELPAIRVSTQIPIYQIDEE